ncbi:DnaJ like protein subfamily C member 19 [Strigomonas culicis]|uniref:DnaJ like protein subfamily C member 19 n=1 Tax=Strigomonas culicis TaxID=28005 RepID=S9W4H0_9TRYP|nr:DnaJ like protein subfamily C member 19 [Strigomonas culicis]|eukprot:EPY30760.1 DnaJ like protein subfamily C member 19 [Strigomonas culicis]
MAAPLVAGALLGGGLYYASRVIPRIAQRARAAGAGTAAPHLGQQPYHVFEYGFQKTMTEREALLLLGFAEKEAGGVLRRPAEEDVKQRYRTLMKDFHSDVGGSPYIAMKLNEAKAVLSR